MVSGLSSVPCRRLVRLRHGGPRSGNVRGSRCALSTGGRRPRAERQRASVRSRKSTALRDGACAGLDTRRVPSTMETRLRRPKSWRSWAAGQCPNGRNGWPCAASSSSGQTARQARCRVSVGRPGRRGHRKSAAEDPRSSGSRYLLEPPTRAFGVMRFVQDDPRIRRIKPTVGDQTQPDQLLHQRRDSDRQALRRRCWRTSGGGVLPVPDPAGGRGVRAHRRGVVRRPASGLIDVRRPVSRPLEQHALTERRTPGLALAIANRLAGRRDRDPVRGQGAAGLQTRRAPLP